jgi:hypothetical protein
MSDSRMEAMFRNKMQFHMKIVLRNVVKNRQFCPRFTYLIGMRESHSFIQKDLSQIHFILKLLYYLHFYLLPAKHF